MFAHLPGGRREDGISPRPSDLPVGVVAFGVFGLQQYLPAVTWELTQQEIEEKLIALAYLWGKRLES